MPRSSILLPTLATALMVATGVTLYKVRPNIINGWTPLPDCQIHESPNCYSSSGDMDPKWENNKWITPLKGDERYQESFQDYGILVGYPRLQYSSDRKKCTVTIITKQKDSSSLFYNFGGSTQSTNYKVFDSSYKKVLQVTVTSSAGAKLVLEPIDFIWNVADVKYRDGDFRNGQKGAIVEFFGWRDEDIEQECQFLADNGYLGAKVFPHMEQLMSNQTMEGELNPWYFMYQPVSYKLSGRMGTRDELRKMIRTCRSKGVRVYADAVINHMTGGGNDMFYHRNGNSIGKNCSYNLGCTYWGPKYSTAGSPFFTPEWTYEYNPQGNPNNVLEYPAVPYQMMDFHCEKPLNVWNDPNILNTGWLTDLADLDTSKDYVRQRICDYMVDLLSIGFSGFRIDAAKHIHPDDLAVILGKFKQAMGGSYPEDFFTWLEVLPGGEADLLLRDSDYSFTTHFTQKLQENGLNDDEITKIKIWWAAYPVDPGLDYGRLPMNRKVIQNDDHDQQNDGSTSRDLQDKGCVLVKGCSPDTHRYFEVKLFDDPYGVNDNDNDFPIRCILSSYYFKGSVKSIPDGMSDCKYCKESCEYCNSREYAKAYNPNAQAYEGSDYTHVHRDQQIIDAMKRWMHIQ